MAQPFKKQTVRYTTPDGQRCSPDTPGAIKRVEESRKYYGLVPQPNGKRKPVPLCPDLSRSRQLLNKLLADAAMRQHGMADPYAEHKRRPLSEHLEDYRRDLEARDNEPRYVRLVFSRLQALLTGCNFHFMDDLSASAVMDWLADLRTRGEARAPLPEGQALFTMKEVATLLGITLPSVGDAISRHGLEVVYQKKRRLLPRAAVELLQDRRAQGVSVQTTNYYLSHLKSFCRWLVKDRRMSDNPMAHLEAGNVEADRRHDRRELTGDELRRLLEVTQASTRTFAGLSGQDRYHLYATACGTGFRASGLASLTPESFDLACDMPTVALAARRNKSRKLKVQPLPADLADLLRGYLQRKPGHQPIWAGTWAKSFKAAEMLRLDLEAAGIPYAMDGPDGPLYVDFHALRHTYLTLGGQADIDLRTLQELAGHSTPTLTARYSHRRLYDLAGAVEKLPSFLPDPGQNTEIAALQATGTDGNITDTSGCGCTLVAHTPARKGHPGASEGNEGKGEGGGEETTQPVDSSALGTSSHPQASGDSEEAPPGFEPGMADLQSAALPLGEGALLSQNVSDPPPRGQSRLRLLGSPALL
jgi:integrase